MRHGEKPVPLLYHSHFTSIDKKMRRDHASPLRVVLLGRVMAQELTGEIINHDNTRIVLRKVGDVWLYRLDEDN